MRGWLLLIAATVAACDDPPPIVPASPPVTVPPDATAVPRTPAPVRLIVSGDVGSEIEVCGCVEGPLGGLARRIGLVRTLTATHAALVLDAGDHFFREPTLNPRLHGAALARADVLAQAARRAGLSAMVVGDRDLALGVDVLRRLARTSSTTLLAANLVYDAGAGDRAGARPFAAHAVIDGVGVVGAVRAGAQYGHVALYRADGEAPPGIDGEAPPGSNGGALRGIDGAAPVVAAARAARSAGARLVVGLLHMPAGEAQALVGRLPPGTLDATISASERQAHAEGPVLQAGARGRSILVVDLDSTRSPTGVRAQLRAIDPVAPADPVTTAAVAGLKARLTALDAPGPRTYSGTAACKGCHAPAYRHWRKTGHARAWASLRRTRQTRNVDCLPCHATGFDRPGGPRRTIGMAPFTNVGCESCHGPGRAHVVSATTTPDYGQVAAQVCRECHAVQGDQRPFDPDQRWAKVLGPGHGR